MIALESINGGYWLGAPQLLALWQDGRFEGNDGVVADRVSTPIMAKAKTPAIPAVCTSPELTSRRWMACPCQLWTTISSAAPSFTIDLRQEIGYTHNTNIERPIANEKTRPVVLRRRHRVRLHDNTAN